MANIKIAWCLVQNFVSLVQNRSPTNLSISFVVYDTQLVYLICGYTNLCLYSQHFQGWLKCFLMLGEKLIELQRSLSVSELPRWLEKNTKKIGETPTTSKQHLKIRVCEQAVNPVFWCLKSSQFSISTLATHFNPVRFVQSFEPDDVAGHTFHRVAQQDQSLSNFCCFRLRK